MTNLDSDLLDFDGSVHKPLTAIDLEVLKHRMWDTGPVMIDYEGMALIDYLVADPEFAATVRKLYENR